MTEYIHMNKKTKSASKSEVFNSFASEALPLNHIWQSGQKTKQVLVVKIGNDAYPLSPSVQEDLEQIRYYKARVKEALKTGLLVVNHTVQLEVMEIPANITVHVVERGLKKSAGAKKIKSPKVNRKEFLKP